MIKNVRISLVGKLHINLKMNPAVGLIQDELAARGISVTAAARDIDISEARLAAVLARAEPLTTDIIEKVALYLDVPAALLLKLQSDFDRSRLPDD